MKYVSFRAPNNGDTWGVLDNDRVYDLGPTGLALAADIVDAIENGSFGRRDLDLTAAPSYDVADIEYLPVIPAPAKIICVGVNYRTHQEETGKPAPKAPTIFTRFADSQMGHLAPAVYPAESSQFDYEGEMALVIGKPAYKVSADRAMEYVAGYAAYNDFSVRDWQRASTQWVPGKNFPATGAFGPWLIEAGALAPLDQVTLQTRVNGEVRQNATLDDLVFDIPSLIEFVSTFTPLAAGDVIVTGTPGGVGLFMEPQGLLSVGDVVEVEITGLGVLRNEVVSG
ncbi:fumarylacetoacetate hydrolase family protein [Microbacterium caowuchunii]|uniref:fumarylacetoacetate hydrolase family protein n=1 Tax=Microbacterium caowuchunii TaxID=2614638 RepID=UPI001243F568|nr:fumarylacetoacetate hydrolase family protein [Microbacterium caowuchunii]QEV99087.1 fumarylacetoacetate hydrolase family protein [Microbacterium caowuchunii]